MVSHKLKGIDRFQDMPEFPKLVELKPEGRVVFVGDTHGDLEASMKVINGYLYDSDKIVFVGDYVDRGKYSKENVEFLYENSQRYPGLIWLIQGNHENFLKRGFMPAEFWNKLNHLEMLKYDDLFQKLPLAISLGGLLVVHGSPPDLKLEDIDDVMVNDSNWKAMMMGDLVEGKGRYFGEILGRPTFGENYFDEVMEKLGKKLLIRGHDYRVDRMMYDDRCLTLFTTNAYGPSLDRNIAIADFSKPIETVKDLEIICLDN